MISTVPKTSTPADSIVSGGQTSGDADAATSAPFDLILAVETLAAQSADSQALAADAALIECGELLGEDEGLEDVEDEAEEGSLEFLAGLLTLAATRTDTAGAPGSANSISAAAGSPTRGEGSGAAAAAVLAGLVEQDASAAGESESRGTADTNSSVAPRMHELQGSVSRTAATEQTVATHVRDPRWSEDFSTRVTLLVRARESQAALQLTPVDLGPVDVNVTVRDSQATIHFGAANADTRALIEASLPKLREMLAAQGFNLLDASVSQGFTQKDQPQSAGVPRPGLDPVSDAEPVTVRHLNGLLDLYA